MPYYSKYRALVVKTDDPEKRGRVKVECPKVLGDSRSAWCEPCLATSFDGDGDFCLPRVGDTIWIEFEDGDPNQPIWVGNWWSEKNTPMPDYDKASETRIISYKGVKFTMTQDCLYINVGNSTLEMTPDEIRLNTPNFFFDGGVDITGHTNIKGDTTITGVTSVTGDTTITGITGINGDTTIVGETDITGDVSMDGNTSITNDLDVSGNASVEGNTDISQNLTVNGATEVEGATTLKNTLKVAGNITAQSNVDVSGTLKVGSVNMNTHIHLIPDLEMFTDVPQN